MYLLANLFPADPRFTNIQTDPRFRLPSKRSTHVQIDKRFAHMLRDDDFSSRAKVDRYGRKLTRNSGKDELKRYYRIEDESEESSEEEDEDEEVKTELERIKAEASTSDDSSSDDEDLDEAAEDEVFGLLEDQEGGNGVPEGELSSRIAVVNLDWDNIRAADLMAVFSSFVPSTGRIRKISIYPSEFGKQRMDKEEMDGPPKEIFGGKSNSIAQNDRSESSEEEEEDVEGNEAEDEKIRKSILKEDRGQDFNSAKLRQYQLERLRYYYAVLDCTSVSVAQAIYDAVDGTEYLTTANFFDLRYISPETDFSEDEPRDECDRIPDGYRPNEFVTDALQHSRVRLTWDADDVSRKEAQKRAFSGSRADIDENDLKAYLGTDSSEDEGPAPQIVDATSAAPGSASNDRQQGEESVLNLSRKEAERQKMRALLGLQSESVSKKSKADRHVPIGDLQVTFSSGLTSEANKGSVFENEPERDETTAEKYIRREKERKARRKEKMKASRTGTDLSVEVVNPAVQLDDKSNMEEGEEQDLGFADPFFTTPTTDKAVSTAQRKADKRQKKEERAAEEAAAASKRAELELLMVDDKMDTKDINHFDINEIAKAEKTLSKKNRSKRKMTEREKQALEAKEKDKFKINVGDERFRDVFESNEFAIDPSHPRFKGTEGMKRLLDEGRKKRRIGNGDDTIGGEDSGRKLKMRRLEDALEGDDVKSLVDRVKGKTDRKGRTERAQS